MKVGNNVNSQAVNSELHAESKPPVPKWQRTKQMLQYREAGIGIVAVLLVVVFQLLDSSFLTVANLKVVFQLSAEIAVVAIAEVIVMVLGEIDLSVGNVFAFAPFIMYFAYEAGLPLIVAVVVGLLSGVAVGWVNAILHVKLHVPSFIATLATLYTVLGITLLMSGGYPVDTPGSGWIVAVMGGAGWSVVVWAIVIGIIWHFLLKRSRFGIYTVAVGSNAVGSREVGIPTDRIRMLNFVLAGLLAATIGIVEGFNVGSIDPLAGGTSLLLEGIAAAVIGGTAMTGGSGTIVGAAIGAFVIAALNDGMNLLGVNAYLFDVVLGVAIAVAMIINIRVVRLRGTIR